MLSLTYIYFSVLLFFVSRKIGILLFIFTIKQCLIRRQFSRGVRGRSIIQQQFLNFCPIILPFTISCSNSFIESSHESFHFAICLRIVRRNFSVFKPNVLCILSKHGRVKWGSIICPDTGGNAKRRENFIQSSSDFNS